MNANAIEMITSMAANNPPIVTEIIVTDETVVDTGDEDIDGSKKNSIWYHH